MELWAWGLNIRVMIDFSCWGFCLGDLKVLRFFVGVGVRCEVGCVNELMG